MKTRIHVFLGKAVTSLVMLLLCHSIALAQEGTNNSNEIQLDKSDVLPVYTNYARVTATADEVVIDFGMFAAPEGKMPPIKVHHQAVMNY